MLRLLFSLLPRPSFGGVLQPVAFAFVRVHGPLSFYLIPAAPGDPILFYDGGAPQFGYLEGGGGWGGNTPGAGAGLSVVLFGSDGWPRHQL